MPPGPRPVRRHDLAGIISREIEKHQNLTYGEVAGPGLATVGPNTGSYVQRIVSTFLDNCATNIPVTISCQVSRQEGLELELKTEDDSLRLTRAHAALQH